MPTDPHIRGSENGNRYSLTGREILTGVTRQYIDITDPLPEQIDMRDIAYSLAHQVRFHGHCLLQPSIAAHSLACEYIAGRLWRGGGWHVTSVFVGGVALRRAALMHDAAEYLVGDVAGAVKSEIRQKVPLHVTRRTGRTRGTSAFDKLEAKAQAAIVARYDCSDAGCEELVHEADCISCAHEMASGGWCEQADPPLWTVGDDRLEQIYALTTREAATAFQDRAHELGMR